MLISILDGAGCITMTHSDLLLLQAWAQRLECHYDHTKMEDANSGCPVFYFFPLKKKKIWVTVYLNYRIVKAEDNTCKNLNGNSFQAIGYLEIRSGTSCLFQATIRS